MGALRIGLTGGIGSGKSTVAQMLVARGAWLIDTDAIARDLTGSGGRAVEAIRAAFGDGYIAADGSLDRARMRLAAFADPASRRRLEAILHPLIGAEVERLIVASPAPVDVLDIPLLVESGRWRARLDRVWVVDCSNETQVSRVSARAGWTADSARAVIAQQASRALRRAAADAVVDNDAGSLARLEAEVDALWCAALALSSMTITDRTPAPL
jgi:dephospho-CoA kinase